MEIISRRQRKTEVSYVATYRQRNKTSPFWSFDCDENGLIDETDLHPVAKENLRKCRNGEYDVTLPPRVTRERHSWVEAAVGRCGCGHKVVLHNFTNTCKCGADYNSSGQQLAARHLWGEETGEHWTDCY